MHTHMGLTRYQRAVRLLERYMKDSGKDYIFTVPLRGLIIKELGSTESTVVQTLVMLREQGVIRETTLNKWKINVQTT